MYNLSTQQQQKLLLKNDSIERWFSYLELSDSLDHQSLYEMQHHRRLPRSSTGGFAYVVL